MNALFLAVGRLLAAIAVWLIRGYQKFISPLTPACCKFYPSCSQYAVQAIQTHGILTGLRLGLLRLGRCHPWSNGGYDPVPGTRNVLTGQISDDNPSNPSPCAASSTAACTHKKEYD